MFKGVMAGTEQAPGSGYPNALAQHPQLASCRRRFDAAATAGANRLRRARELDGLPRGRLPQARRDLLQRVLHTRGFARRLAREPEQLSTSTPTAAWCCFKLGGEQRTCNTSSRWAAQAGISCLLSTRTLAPVLRRSSLIMLPPLPRMQPTCDWSTSSRTCADAASATPT